MTPSPLRTSRAPLTALSVLALTATTLATAPVAHSVPVTEYSDSTTAQATYKMVEARDSKTPFSEIYSIKNIPIDGYPHRMITGRMMVSRPKTTDGPRITYVEARLSCQRTNAGTSIAPTTFTVSSSVPAGSTNELAVLKPRMNYSYKGNWPIAKGQVMDCTLSARFSYLTWSAKNPGKIQNYPVSVNGKLMVSKSGERSYLQEMSPNGAYLDTKHSNENATGNIVLTRSGQRYTFNPVTHTVPLSAGKIDIGTDNRVTPCTAHTDVQIGGPCYGYGIVPKQQDNRVKIKVWMSQLKSDGTACVPNKLVQARIYYQPYIVHHRAIPTYASTELSTAPGCTGRFKVWTTIEKINLKWGGAGAPVSIQRPQQRIIIIPND